MDHSLVQWYVESLKHKGEWTIYSRIHIPKTQYTTYCGVPIPQFPEQVRYINPPAELFSFEEEELCKLCEKFFRK